MLINYLKKTEKISPKTYNIIKRLILSFGLLALASGLIINRYYMDMKGMAFISGFLIGLSIVLNIVGIILNRPAIKE